MRQAIAFLARHLLRLKPLLYDSGVVSDLTWSLQKLQQPTVTSHSSFCPLALLQARAAVEGFADTPVGPRWPKCQLRPAMLLEAAHRNGRTVAVSLKATSSATLLDQAAASSWQDIGELKGAGGTHQSRSAKDAKAKARNRVRQTLTVSKCKPYPLMRISEYETVVLQKMFTTQYAFPLQFA